MGLLSTYKGFKEEAKRDMRIEKLWHLNTSRAYVQRTAELGEYQAIFDAIQDAYDNSKNENVLRDIGLLLEKYENRKIYNENVMEDRYSGKYGFLHKNELEELKQLGEHEEV